MFNLLFSVTAFILVLFPLVMLHEFGHYCMARYYGVGVEAFSIGMGPELVGWQDKNGTRWKVCLFLVGGYVKMVGDSDIASSSPEKGVAHKENSLFAKHPFQRIMVAAAGPLINYAWAFILMVGLMATVGRQDYKPVLGTVEKTGLAFQSGLRPGDRILAMQGASTTTYSRMEEILHATPRQENLCMEVQRAEQMLSLCIKHPQPSSQPWFGSLGVSRDAEASCYSGPLPWGQCLQTAGHFLWSSFHALKIKSLDSLQGPLGIAHQSSLIMKKGFVDMLFFMAQLSAGLGLLNLLPIPLLDGGSILLTTLEWIRRRPLGERLQNVIFTLALVGLGLLFLTLSWKDLLRLIG